MGWYANLFVGAGSTLLAATLGAIILALIQRWDWLGWWLLLRPMRRAAATLDEQEIGRELRIGLRRRLHQPDVVAGADVIEELIFKLPEAKFSRDDADVVDSLLASLSGVKSHGIFTRLVYSVELSTLSRIALSVRGALKHHLAAEENLPSIDDSAISFGKWVSARTGAIVMLDSAQSRAKVAHDLLVWHNPLYRGNNSVSTFEAAHNMSCSSMDRLVQCGNLEEGDYDGRVLVLDGCSYLRRPGKGSFVFLLRTSESCYAVTEDWRGGGGCKNIPSGETDIDIRFDPSTGRFSDGRRRCLLSSYVAVISADRKLVLCRRSRGVRTGQGVISSTAGGVCEPGVPGAGDRDAFGWPDPLASAVRELKEEIGIQVDRSRVYPVCVFLANLRNPSEENRGQLVATVLSICHSECSFSEIRKASWSRSDLSSGRFEVNDLIGINLSQSVEGFAESASEYVDDLDQHGALSVLYSSVLLYGRGDTEAAFDSQFPESGGSLLERRMFELSSIISNRG